MYRRKLRMSTVSHEATFRFCARSHYASKAIPSILSIKPNTKGMNIIHLLLLSSDPEALPSSQRISVVRLFDCQ
ncbi:hypothetical protein PISMIDRAFT_678728 [Pisolithus microcarpus 441]|uniref:Unplaced genomic scaffold scaffold_37, whole genome shotgun sequence n=1 Tax=Pisolithus microcarpus 441 TaxID=765257 RepID=A0A0C9ZNV0_9AGAM|nr:hypothetical protein PISMIDRAFT_678728 [Pisolithus microcarpus 441]